MGSRSDKLINDVFFSQSKMETAEIVKCLVFSFSFYNGSYFLCLLKVED